jgi:hypothetical protein
MPVGRHARCLDFTLVDHPALAATTGGHALVLIVAIALLVGADEFAAQFGEQPSAERHQLTLSKGIAACTRATCGAQRNARALVIPVVRHHAISTIRSPVARLHHLVPSTHWSTKCSCAHKIL